MTDSSIEPRGREELEALTLADLHTVAHELGIERYRRLRRAPLIERILDAQGGVAAGDGDVVPLEPQLEPVPEVEPQLEPVPGPEPEPEVEPELEPEPEPEVEPQPEPPVELPLEPVEPEEELREGLLDLRPEGFGLVRVSGFFAAREDVYVSQSQVRRLRLRTGDEVRGPARPQRRTERHAALTHIDSVNDRDAEDVAWLRDRLRYAELTPVAPSTELKLDAGALGSGLKGKLGHLNLGQRVLIAGDGREAAADALRSLVKAAGGGSPDVKLLSLLVDPRPEDVTIWLRDTTSEVVDCGLDRTPRAIVDGLTLAVEHAQRLCESGRHLLLVIDSFTQLAGIFALAESPGGRRAGDIDLGAIRTAKRILSVGRAFEEEGAGSVTVVGSALTGPEGGNTGRLAGELAQLANVHVEL